MDQLMEGNHRLLTVTAPSPDDMVPVVLFKPPDNREDYSWSGSAPLCPTGGGSAIKCRITWKLDYLKVTITGAAADIFTFWSFRIDGGVGLAGDLTLYPIFYLDGS